MHDQVLVEEVPVTVLPHNDMSMMLVEENAKLLEEVSRLQAENATLWKLRFDAQAEVARLHDTIGTYSGRIGALRDLIGRFKDAAHDVLQL